MRIRGFRLLTEKPVLVVLNVGESDIERADERAADLAKDLLYAQTDVAAHEATAEQLGFLEESIWKQCRQAVFDTLGTAGRFGATNAQCCGSCARMESSAAAQISGRTTYLARIT